MMQSIFLLPGMAIVINKRAFLYDISNQIRVHNGFFAYADCSTAV